MPVVDAILRNEVAFLFILVRVASFIVAIPLIGGASVPGVIKVMLVLSMSVMLFQFIEMPQMVLSPSQLTSGLVGEVLIGLTIGLSARFLFGAVEIGSEIVGMQMGLGSANLFDPISNQQASLIGRLQGLVAMLIFLGAYGHFMVIEALVESFRWVPSMGFYPKGSLIQELMRLAGGMFVLGLKISVPIIVALLLANVAIGIFSRVMPQLNVMLFSFPITITLGLVMLGLSLPMVVALLSDEIAGLRTLFPQLLKGMRP